MQRGRYRAVSAPATAVALVALSAFLAACAHGPSGAQARARTFDVVRTEGTIVIDGTPDEADWQRAPGIEMAEQMGQVPWLTAVIGFMGGGIFMRLTDRLLGCVGWVVPVDDLHHPVIVHHKTIADVLNETT